MPWIQLSVYFAIYHIAKFRLALIKRIMRQNFNFYVYQTIDFERLKNIIEKENAGNSIDFLAHLSTTCSRGAFRVVRCPSSNVNNFFKHLLPNRWANLDQTWQECYLGGPLQKLFTEFDSIKNSGCHGNEIEFFKQFFKNLQEFHRNVP